MRSFFVGAAVAAGYVLAAGNAPAEAQLGGSWDVKVVARWAGTFRYDIARGCADVQTDFPTRVEFLSDGRARFLNPKDDIFAVSNDWVWRQSGSSMRIETTKFGGQYINATMNGPAAMAGTFYQGGCYGTMQLRLQ